MDYYYTACSDSAALTAKDLAGGPAGKSSFGSAEAKDVLACPHLEQLVTIATGNSQPSLVTQLQTLWPEPGSPNELEPGTMITRLPDSLRDGLAMIELTPAVAEAWASELWGFDPIRAATVATDVVRIARQARDSGQPLYWWSEM